MLGLGLAVALCSPVSVVTVILLLSMPAGRRRAIAFVVGWLLAIVLIAAVTVFVLHGQDFGSTKTTPSKTASAAEIVAGCLILLVSVRAFRRRSRASGTATAETPKWLDRLDQTNWLLAALVGAFMLTYSLTIAAASEILKADLSRSDDVVAFAVYMLASITTIVAPIVVAVVAPERSAQRLEGWRRWLLGNSRTVGLVALMVIGGILIGRGVLALA